MARHPFRRVGRPLLLVAPVLASCGGSTGPEETGNPGNTAPTVSITAPASNGLLVTDLTSVTFTATATDAQEGDVSSSIEWSSSVDGMLGTGATVDATLSVGTHVVTATARDGGGLNGSATRNITSVEFAWTAVTAGAYHTCGLAIDGSAYCWGAKGSGDRPLGTTAVTESQVPVAVEGGHGFTALASGSSHTCGLLSTGGAMCWGSMTRDEGLLGNGDPAGSVLPVPVQSSGSFTHLSAGHDYTCALDASGRGRCWGSNWAGTMGGGVPVDELPYSTTPASLDTPAQFTMLRAGVDHACAVTSGGDAYCWGRDDTGQVGDGEVNEWSLSPVPVVGGLTWQKIAPGASYTAALDVAGRAYFWGSRIAMNGHSYQDPSDLQPEPDTIPSVETFTDIVSRAGYGCALGVDGGAFCWGAGYAQVGSPRDEQPEPVPIGGGLSFVQLSAGEEHVCGRTAAGRIYCWGRGESGQLGDGQAQTSADPVEVLDPS